VLLTAGQSVVTIQALGAINQLSIRFPEPAGTVMAAMSVLVINVDVFRVTCLVVDDNPVTKFALQLMVYPMFLFVLGVVWVIARKINRQLHLNTIFNLIGMLLLGFFISLTLTVLSPFQCMRSPCDFLSEVSNPVIACWTSGDHTSLIVISIVGALLFCVHLNLDRRRRSHIASRAPTASTGLAATASCLIALDRSGTTTGWYI